MTLALYEIEGKIPAPNKLDPRVLYDGGDGTWFTCNAIGRWDFLKMLGDQHPDFEMDYAEGIRDAMIEFEDIVLEDCMIVATRAIYHKDCDGRRRDIRTLHVRRALNDDEPGAFYATVMWAEDNN